MNINEVEKELTVSRANVYFYEKEGLISPKRKENNYRDYDEGDIQQLKKVLIFRKLGFTIEEISDMQNGQLDLEAALSENIKRLEATIEELNGSLELARQIENEHTDYENVDENHYWEVLNKEENAGRKFVDIYKDYIKVETYAFESMWKWVFFHDFNKSKAKHGVLKAFGILGLICIIRFIARIFLWKEPVSEAIFTGLLYPFLLFLGVSIIILPIVFLAEKAPKAASIIINILLFLCIGFFALIAFVLIFGLLNTIFNFW